MLVIPDLFQVKSRGGVVDVKGPEALKTRACMLGEQPKRPNKAQPERLSFCRRAGDGCRQAPQDAASVDPFVCKRRGAEAANSHRPPAGGGGRWVLRAARSAVGSSLGRPSLLIVPLMAVSGPGSSLAALPNVVTSWGGAPANPTGARPKRSTANYTSAQPGRFVDGRLFQSCFHSEPEVPVSANGTQNHCGANGFSPLTFRVVKRKTLTNVPAAPPPKKHKR